MDIMHENNRTILGQGYDFVTIPDLLDARLKPHQLYFDRDQ